MAKIELEVFYPYPIEHVWNALTEPESLNQWIMSNEDFKPIPGQKFVFKDKPVMGWKGVFYCQVLEVDKPNRFSWLQSEEENSPSPHTITWILKTEGNGTRVSLTQEGFKGLKGQIMRKVMGEGWKLMLEKRLPIILKYAAQNGWNQFPENQKLVKVK